MRVSATQQLKSGHKRRGAVIVLMAICLVVLLAVTAFCIDIGWATLATSGLQNAADSAATAAAAALNQGYATYSIPTQTNQSGVIASAEATATSWAQNYSSYNASGDVASLNLSSADVVFSQMNSSGTTSTTFTGFPNTVTVTLRRDGTTNSSLPMFFASVIGTKSVNLTATASATIYTGSIISFSASGGGEGSAGGYGGWGSSYSTSGSSSAFNNLLLPIALDAGAWSSYVNTGASPSNSTYASISSSGSSSSGSGCNGSCGGGCGGSCGGGSNWWSGYTNGSPSSGCGSSGCNWWDACWSSGASSGSWGGSGGSGGCGSCGGSGCSGCSGGSSSPSSSSNCNGAPECCVYPSPSNCPGMTGCIALDGCSNSDSNFCNWVKNGASASDIKNMCNQGCFPCTSSTPKTCCGSAGVSSTVAASFASIVGQQRIMPVFQASSVSPYQGCSGSGSNTQYQICGFVGVKVTSVTGSGSSTCINVQPCCVVDPTAVFDKSTLVPCGCEPSTQMKTYTCTAPKFCK